MRIDRISSECLKPFFLDLVRRSFGQLGVGDRETTDYVAAILADFSRSERWLMMRNAQGRRLHSVVEMLLETLGPDSSSRRSQEREVRKFVGDYTLFMAGLFRGFAEKGGFLDFYLTEGRRSYLAVSELDVSLYRPGFLLFQELGKGFENYAGALDYMQKCFFARTPGTNPFAGFYRQLESLVGSAGSDN